MIRPILTLLLLALISHSGEQSFIAGFPDGEVIKAFYSSQRSAYLDQMIGKIK